jgi:hypothetical protein
MRNYSIAIFGSSIRMDFDKYSDKDLLIVADSFFDVKELILRYESKGFSVSFYTYKKLELLSMKQSLFIEHLKRESFIFVDHSSRLADFLRTVSTITSSSERICEATKYFSLFDFIPLDSFGFGWFCDVFYVGFRNYLINLSANNGSYKFSYMDLLSDIYNTNEINESEFEILRQLRVIKGNFRNKLYHELPKKDFIKRVIAFSNKMKFTKGVSFVEKSQIEKIVKAKLTNANSGYYQKLRLLEIYYYMSNIELPNVEKLIINPQSYANILKSDDFILAQLKRIDRKKRRHVTKVLQPIRLDQTFTFTSP